MTGIFFNEEQRKEYETAFPYHAQAGPSGHANSGTSPKLDKGKRRVKSRGSYSLMDASDEAEDGFRSRGPSPSSTPEPQRMAAPPPPVSFSVPLRTSLDMPIRGSKEAPKTFRGKHTEVQRFIDHFELLLNKCRVTDDQEKCEQVLNYCTVDVQNVIQTMEGYEQRKWSKLRKEILKQFDAERALQKYKPADVERYAAKMKSQPCYNLTQ
jgi:hypothetical protein